MPPGIFLIHEGIVIDKIAVASVVGRVNVDAFDATGEGHAEMTEGVEVIAFDDEVAPRGLAAGKDGIEVEGDEIVVEGLLALDFVGFPRPNQSARGFPALSGAESTAPCSDLHTIASQVPANQPLQNARTLAEASPAFKLPARFPSIGNGARCFFQGLESPGLTGNQCFAAGCGCEGAAGNL